MLGFILYYLQRGGELLLYAYLIINITDPNEVYSIPITVIESTTDAVYWSSISIIWDIRLS